MSRNPTGYLTRSAPIEGFTDAEKFDQIDVSDEQSRTYVFGVDKAYRIDLPLIVAVKRGPGGHSHRVIDVTGRCHYIPKGWIAIYWTLRADTAILLPDLSGCTSEAQEIEAADDEVIMPPPSEAQDAAGLTSAEASDLHVRADEAGHAVEVLTPTEEEDLEQGLEMNDEDEDAGYVGPY